LTKSHFSKRKNDIPIYIRASQSNISINMTTKRFSKAYRTFQDWTAKAKPTPYTQEIKRLHGIHPKATLPQLRRHPGKGEELIGHLPGRPIHQRPWGSLTPRGKEQREKALKVLSVMRRKGLSLTRASREVRISPSSVRRITHAYKRVGRRWKANRYDRIERKMNINTGGHRVSITVRSSRYASIIGKYHSAVREFLETGDVSVLKPFKGKRIKDAHGNWHILDTDPDTLYDIQDMNEDEEFYTIYAG
jgi:hypothetical protein